MASILAGIYCWREKQWSTSPKLKRNPSSPLFLPCCVWLWVVLDQGTEVGNGSCGCSELGWLGCLCLPGPEQLHLVLCLWTLLSGGRAACRLFLEIFSLYVHIPESHGVVCCKPLWRTEALHPYGRGAVQRAGKGGRACEKGLWDTL